MPARSSTAAEHSCRNLVRRNPTQWVLLGGFCAALLFAQETAAEERYAQPSAALFRLSSAQRYFSLGGSYIWNRSTASTRYSGGFELQLSDGLTWQKRTFFIQSLYAASFRVLDDGYALSLFQSGGLAGLKWHFLELKGGVTLGLVNVDVIAEKWNASPLWPRASSVLGVDLGAVRVEAQLYTEYWWRWFGEDQFVRGVGLSISLQRPAQQDTISPVRADGS